MAAIDDNIGIRTELLRRGQLIPASDPAPLALPSGEPDPSFDSAELISALREERL